MGGRGLTIKKIFMLCCLFICLRIETAVADDVSCNANNTDFTANSTYSKNRDTVLATLASNVAANDGFYNSSLGNGSDTVYATALCRGDASTTECSSCVTTVANNSISKCPLQYKVFSWAGDPPCFVHYDNTNIFAVLEMDPPLFEKNTDTISWNSSGFYETWADLMDKLRNEAADGSSKRKYAARDENFTLTRFIYGLVQCTPDLSKSDCDQCLKQTIADSDEMYHGLRGGLIYRPSCIFQYSLDPFYKEDDNSPPQSPGPSSTGNGGGSSATTIATVVGSVAIFIVLVAAGLFLFRRLRKRRKMAVQLIEIDEDGSRSSKFSHLDFGTIRAATDDFSDNKKLGQGGFGTVYKGTLPNGQEIAVKRLARNSQQGDLEFQSEVKLMTKLRHRNLVRLIGFSTEKEERVLVYEFLPNSSLNNYIFGKTAIFPCV
ncbi:hypothetical protein ACFE04_000802 [Oxalis oulophora]